MKRNTSFDSHVVETFNLALDRFLSTGQVSADIQHDPVHFEMLSIAQSLATANLASLSKGRASLRKRLLAHEPSPAHRGLPRAVKWAATLVLLLIVLITAFSLSPPLRTWAQGVLARIGNLIITDAPTGAEQTLPRLLTATPGPHRATPFVSLSQEEASQRAGFTVLVPRDVPEKEWEAMYKPSWGTPKKVTWDIFEIPNGMVVRCECYRWHSLDILQLDLRNVGGEEFPIGDADVLEVTVRGQTGYWIEEAATRFIGGGGSALHLTQDDIVWQLGHNNILTWEEGGIVYVIMADDELSLEDNLTVAECLAP